MLARVALPRCCRAAATPAVAPSPLASPDLVVRHTRASPPPLRVGLPGGTLGPRLARDPAVGKAADAPLAPTVRLGGARAATLAAPASRRRPAPAGALAAAGPAGVDAWVEDESLLAALRLSRAVAAARDALRADPLSLAGARAGREQAVALAGAALPSAGADDAAVARAAGLPSPAAVRAAESAGCRAAAELLRRHLGLVKAQAARAIADAGPHARLAMEDAVQEGARGLLKAAATFEARGGA